MARHDLVRDITLATGIIQSDVELVLAKAIELIRIRVTEGKEVHLNEFGVFKQKLRGRKVARNLGGRKAGKRKNPEPIILPETLVPHFKPSKKFLKAA